MFFRARLIALLTGCALITAGPAAAGETVNPTTTAKEIVRGFDKIFGGPHEGHRAAHAKGILLQGVFSPAEAAKGLTRAEHLQGEDVPVLVRLSNFAGVPTIPDNSEAGAPRGMAIKFVLEDGGSTDIVAHSYNGFPAATPEEMLDFVRALGSEDPDAFPRHLAGHPAAQAFVDTPKPAPVSFATERFFGVNAFEFTNEAGNSRFGKYFIEPVAGPSYLSEGEARRQTPDYLMQELVSRLEQGPAQFRLVVQLAGEGDSLVDGSRPWPEDRETVELGILELTSPVAANAEQQRTILFTPLSLVGGIAPSADPMLVSRTRAYRVSHQRRSQDDGPSQATQ